MIERMKYISPDVFFRSLIIGFLGLLFGTGFSGCKKEVASDQTEHSVFMRVFPAEGNQNCNFVKELPDHSLLLFINEGKYIPNDDLLFTIIRMNPDGTIISSTKFSDYDMRDMWQTFICRDGSMLVSSGSQGTYKIIKLSPYGELLWIRDFGSFLSDVYFTGYAVEGSDGIIRILATNGPASYTTASYQFSYSSAGEYLGSLRLNSAMLPNNKFYFGSMYKYGNGQTQYFAGFCYLKSATTFDWNERLKPFVSKLVLYEHDTTLAFTTSTILDTIPDDNAYEYCTYRYTPKNDLYFVSTVTDKNSRVKINVKKINELLQQQWSTDVMINQTECSMGLSMEENNKGNLIICGGSRLKGKSSEQGMVCLLGQQGEILKSRIFEINNSSHFNYALQLSDGSYLLVGATTGFGSGKTGADMLIMKTDENFNYQK